MKPIITITLALFFASPFFFSCRKDCPEPTPIPTPTDCDSVICWARYYWYGTLTETPTGFHVTGIHRDTSYSTLLCNAADSTQNKEALLKPFVQAQGLEKRFHETYNKVWYVNGEVTKWGFIECGCY